MSAFVDERAFVAFKGSLLPVLVCSLPFPVRKGLSLRVHVSI